MAGGGGAAGPAPSIRYQAPRAQTRRVTATICIYNDNCLFNIPASGSVPPYLRQKIAGSRLVCNFFERVQNRLNVDIRVRTGMYWFGQC